jgi:hypothetical protein
VTLSDRMRPLVEGKFNPVTPMSTRQVDRWSCAPIALLWALESLGTSTTLSYLTEGLTRDEYLVAQDGLGMVDKTGVDLAEFINRKFGFIGIQATAFPNADTELLVCEAGRWPIVVYGERWQHWTAIRGYDTRSQLFSLANSADPLLKIPRQTASAAELTSLGPLHAVILRRR